MSSRQQIGGCPWRLALAVLAAVALTLAAGCTRGRPSARRPIHINPNMDDQPRFKAQAGNTFFADGSNLRPPVSGTVPRGGLAELQDRVTVEPYGITLEGSQVYAYYTGLQPPTGGEPVTVQHSPLPFSKELLRRGQDRFNIYCSICHDATGSGQGLIIRRNMGMVPPPSYHADTILAKTDGDLFNVITNGIRTMPTYRQQVPVADRWAIVAYIRALQRSQHATLDDVPVAERARLQP